MSDDQFNQIMRLIQETNSIARGTAVAVAILYDKIDAIEKDIVQFDARIERLESRLLAH